MTKNEDALGIERKNMCQVLNSSIKVREINAWLLQIGQMQLKRHERTVELSGMILRSFTQIWKPLSP